MNFLSWLALGLLVGIIANIIDPRPAKGGLLGSIVLGVAGALVGGFLATLIFGVGVTGFDVQSFLVATAGALILLFIGRALIRA